MDGVRRVGKAGGYVEHVARPKDYVEQRRRQLVEPQRIVRLAPCQRVGVRLRVRRRRCVYSPTLGTATLQDEDVLLVRVRRRRGGAPLGGHVQVEAVGQPEGVERR